MPGGDLSVGDRDPRVTDLRRRLLASGELAPQGTRGDLFDDRLASAVTLPRRRHGLAQTGSINRRTMLAMNVQGAPVRGGQSRPS